MQHVADYRQQLQDGYNVVESVATTTTSSIILVPTYALCQPAANTCCSYYMAGRPAAVPRRRFMYFFAFLFKNHAVLTETKYSSSCQTHLAVMSGISSVAYALPFWRFCRNTHGQTDSSVNIMVIQSMEHILRQCSVGPSRSRTNRRSSNSKQ